MKVSLPGRNPDFVGFGVHRSGSTWLSSQLRQHQGLWTPPTILKEVHYFDELHVPEHHLWHTTRIPALTTLLQRAASKASTEGDLRRIRRFAELGTSVRDDDWYRSVFGICGDPDRKVGEITPGYSLMGIEGVEHLKRVSPDVAVFLVLRDPAERVWSHLKLGLKQEIAADASILNNSEDLLRRANGAGVVARTQYRRMIETLEAVFSADKIHVSFYDRVSEEPVAMLTDLAHHIGVDPSGFNTDDKHLEHRHHSSPSASVPLWLREWSAETFGSDIAWLADRFGGYPQRWLDNLP